MIKDNYVVYTLYSGLYYGGIYSKYMEDPDYIIVRDNLTEDEARDFATVMNKLKGII